MITVMEEEISENFRCAYANVGILSDDTWAYNSNVDLYRKANQELWIRVNETEQRLLDTSIKDNNNSLICSEYPQTVRNVIPNSRLAQYGDYLYEKKADYFYVTDNSPAECMSNNIFENKNDYEIWMLPEVEEEFKRLTCLPPSRRCSSSSLSENEDTTLTYLKQHNADYIWLTTTPWPNIILSLFSELPGTLQDPKSLFQHSANIAGSFCFSSTDKTINVFYDKTKKKKGDYSLPKYFVNSNDEFQLCIILTSPSVQSIWDRVDGSSDSGETASTTLPPSKSLNVDVPEFQPTKKRNDFPPFYDFNYDSDLFPYSETKFAPNILAPTSCMMSSTPDSVGNFQNVIPVYQRPPEFYFRTDNTTNHKKRGVGADLNNLILLTQDEGCNEGMQSHQLESLHEFPQLPQRSVQPMPTNKESCHKTLLQVNKWLDKVYPIRSTNFNDISSTTIKMEKLATKVQNYCISLNNPIQMDLSTQPLATLSESPTNKRRLYKDVLTSGENCNDIENKFEELEREALEQYAGSDTSLINTSSSVEYSASEDNMVTRRYQDLEREAVEQYHENESNYFELNLDGEENIEMIPIVKMPHPDPPMSVEKESCFSLSFGNSQTELSPRSMLECTIVSGDAEHPETNNVQVLDESWAQMLARDCNQRPWLKKKKKKLAKKKKTKQKKNTNNDSSKDT